MTSNPPTGMSERLRLGIDAARAGAEPEARRHLIAVLKQDGNHVPALLWLAFVMPSPQDTIRLLQRVLVLEPDNERAKAGIRWARSRLVRDADATAEQPHQASGRSIRQKRLSARLKKEARPGLAQRGRRTIRPMLVIIFVTGLIGLMSIGLGALAFIPSDVLAAWLPAVENTFVAAETTPAEAAVPIVEPAEASAVPVSPGFSAESDTLDKETLETLEAYRLEIEPIESTAPAMTLAELPVETTSADEGTASVLPAEPELPAIEPATLQGPEAFKPFDNLLLAHQPAYPGEKWIEINVTTQQITAWEGDVPVFSFTGSTGLPNTPTVLGEFNIYWKLESTLMTGPGYYLPEVPYTMYFYGGYALHGTYWHDNFGQPMSHGCVNLETGSAKKLFEWADPVLPPGQSQVVATADNPGTLVVVHQ